MHKLVVAIWQHWGAMATFTRSLTTEAVRKILKNIHI